ncbi:conserved hypothetical protein [Clostridium neonatale]|uniref:hypothetical protein n=1 Tax=Clostridium neonatale TaxID=137838 RepID=UPI00291BCEC2|nr:hypothetical protein [Clostridium neonatale]CAI3242205.1 conserved hypothetical protein [Clostridium neonatale]
MAKGKRKTIILNPDNPKEKVILDLLEQQYNASEFIKDLLFNYIQKQNNNNLHDDNTMIIQLPHDDNLMTNVLPHDDNTIATPLSHNDNAHNSNFFIDLNKVSDTDVEINASASEDPNKNALDFLKNFGG